MELAEQSGNRGRAWGREQVEQKVNDFARQEQAYKSRDFTETTTRTRFIDPLFQALGWDFDQTGVARHLWDVHEEKSHSLSASAIMRPDYTFRHKGKTKFFVEAKAPHVDLTAKDPVFQAKSYAFSTNGKAPIVILTDFEEFRVFNALERPIFDNPLDGLIRRFDLKYSQYLDHWDSLYDTFSREAVANNSLAALVGKAPRLAKTLDREFLADLTRWRELLAKRVASDNTTLSVEAINECVQRILDRLVFIRNLEDREIKDETLLGILEKSSNRIYPRLVPIFERLDREYNGLIFKRHLSDEIIVDDRPLREIIPQLYPRRSPYRFDVIEPEILGRIYERFLGSKIRLTASHRAKVEEKPEVRHAGGVYYTPEWVVDHIVENSIGKLVAGKTPAEIEQIKILDPACGSGSFLLGAFSWLITYHEGWYENWRGSAKQYKNDFYTDTEGRVRLRLRKKAAILQNNIFGVDIDREATEVAIMSLYLKLLDQGRDAGEGELVGRGFLLPEMEGNIKCGNSLIDDSMFGLDFNMNEKVKLKPFDWDIQFPEIMEGNKFDCVIGNPPYIRSIFLKETDPFTWNLYKENYESAKEHEFDIYLPFLERASQLINKEGYLSYIMPNKWLHATMGKKMRQFFIKKKQISEIVNFKAYQVFENATNYTMIITAKGAASESFAYYEYNGSPDVSDIDLNFKQKHWDKNRIQYKDLTDQAWSFQDRAKGQILEKISGHEPLERFLRIGQGTGTRADGIFFVTKIGENRNEYQVLLKEDGKTYWIEKKFVKPSLKGKNIDKFSISSENNLLIFPYADKELIPLKTIKKETPKLYDLLYAHKRKLESREKGRWKGKHFHCYGRPQNHAILPQRKILIPAICNSAGAVWDDVGYHVIDSVYIAYILDKRYSPFFYIALLNSNLLTFFLKQTGTDLRGGYFTMKTNYLNPFPIAKPDQATHDSMVRLSKNLHEINQTLLHDKSMLDFNRNIYEQEKTIAFRKLNKLIYDLYGLNQEEIGIIEENLR